MFFIRSRLHMTPMNREKFHGNRSARFYSRGASDARVIAIIACLSVCHTPVSTRLKVGSRKQHHVIAQDSSFLTPKFVGGWFPYPPKICAQSDPPPFKQHNFDQYLLIAPQPWELAKIVQLALIGSRPRALQRAIDEPYTLPLSPPMGGTKRDFAIFSNKFQLLSKKEKVCYKVSLC